MTSPMRVVVWVVEGTWRGCIDAAVTIIPTDAQVTLLHVTPSDVAEAAEAASTGLLGRVRPAWVHRVEDVVEAAASELLASAATRLGREPVECQSLRGRVEREVIRAIAENVDMLVAARDGDRSRLGPHSLGRATRFVVDHAPCAVLLVWPDEPPGTDSIPPPPQHPPPHHPPPPPEPPA